MAKKNLLLVDADSKDLRLLEVSLRKSGFSVTSAMSAADAREKVKLSQPDLILTETKLPGDESGFELVANLKASPETQGIPIIFLSSENKLEQKVTGLELGVEDYLTKPIYTREVLTRVRVLLEKKDKEKLGRRERSASFTGHLGEMGLVDLMQTVEIGRKTGKLHVETHDTEGWVFFREGKICDARCGTLSGERAFYRMLVWSDGSFTMDFGAHDEPDVIDLSTQGLLMEGMRRVDEWGRLLEQLPPLDRIFEIDFGELVDRLAEIPDEINGILRLFDGRRTLLEVVDESDFGDLEALEIASKLYFEGLIFDITERAPHDDPGAQQVQKAEQWLEGGSDDLLETRIEPTPPSSFADDISLATQAGRFAEADLAPDELPPPLADGGEAGEIAAPPTHEAVPLQSTHTPLPQALPSPLPAATGAPVAGFVAHEVTDAPRPLPRPQPEVHEPPSVLPRAAVGATAWSLPPVAIRQDDGGWEDVEATLVDPDGGSTLRPAPLGPSSSPPLRDDDDLGLNETVGKRAPGRPLAPIRVDAPVGLDGALGRHEGSPVLRPGQATEEDLGAQIAAALRGSTATEQVASNDTIPDLRFPGPTVVDPVQASIRARSDVPGSSPPGQGLADGPSRGPPPPPPDTPYGGSAASQPPISTGPMETIADLPRVGASPAVEARRGFPTQLVAALVFLLAVGAGAVWGFLREEARVGAKKDDERTAGSPMKPPKAAPTTPVTPAPIAPPPAPAAEAIADADGPRTPADPRPASPATPPASPPAAPPSEASPPEAPPPSPAQEYVAHLKEAEALSRRGDFAKAIRAYKAALEARPNAVAALIGLGNAYYELDNLDAALSHLELARSLAPRDAQVYVLLGAVYQSKGRPNDAVQAYKRYLDLAPNGRFASDVAGILKGLSAEPR